MPDLPRPATHLSTDEIDALANGVADEMGLTAMRIEDVPAPPVRWGGLDEWRLPAELTGVPLDKLSETGRSWADGERAWRKFFKALRLSEGQVTVYAAFEPNGYFGLMP